MAKADRRRFLKNTSLAALAAAILPAVGKSSSARTSKKADFIGCLPTTLDLYGEGPFYT